MRYGIWDFGRKVLFTMHYRAKISVLVSSFSILWGFSAHAYFGVKSTEARLTFKAVADIKFETPAPTTHVTLLNDIHTKDFHSSRRALRVQISHLMGTFQSDSFVLDMDCLTKHSDSHPCRKQMGHQMSPQTGEDHESPVAAKRQIKGVLGERHEIKFTKVDPGSERGRYRVEYEFDGVVVFKKEVFKAASTFLKVPVRLPYAPDKAYVDSIINGVSSCTGKEHDSEGDFFYFWDPLRNGCSLKKDSQYISVLGKIEEIENTGRVNCKEDTYPEYDLLYGLNDPKKNTLEIAVLIGYIDELSNVKWPHRKDDGMLAFQSLEKYLGKSFNISKFNGGDPFRLDIDGRLWGKTEGRAINFKHTYEKKKVQIQGTKKTINIKVTVLLADTDIMSKDHTFYHHWKDALANADIIYYDGHSGLGGNLDLANFEGIKEEIKMNKEKYQIIFFNGCSSYPYFKGMYHRAKEGTKFLDIITSGLPTFSDTSNTNAKAFLTNFIMGETNSWQKIMLDIEASNKKDSGSYLVGVSGDEDNVFRPSKWGMKEPGDKEPKISQKGIEACHSQSTTLY